MAKKKKYSAAERRAYWAGVGSGLKENKNHLPYDNLRGGVVNFNGKVDKSFQAGRERAINANSAFELIPKRGKKYNRPKKTDGYLKSLR